MHRTAGGQLKELDDHHDTSYPPGDNLEGVYDRISIAPENGFVSLAVGESVDVQGQLKFTGEGAGLDLEKGEKYSLNFRGTWLLWWRFGSLEVRFCFLLSR